MQSLQIRHNIFGIFQGIYYVEEASIAAMYWTDSSSTWYFGIYEFDQYSAIEFIHSLIQREDARFMPELLSIEPYDFELNRKLKSIIWFGSA